MNVDRKPIFQAVREIRNGQGFTIEEVNLLDAAIDQAFQQPVTEPAPATEFNEGAFFDSLRGSKALGPTLSTDEVEGCQAIVGACRAGGYPMAWTAYALATAYHETAATMRPIREYGRGKGRKYGQPGKHGQVGYGRGYVQLTWDNNYEKADAKLGLGGRLTADYDLALDPKIAADIMVRGMAEGWFTGKRLADYLPAAGPATRTQFEQSRRIINGTDKAALIAGHALEFQRALQAGGM
jgi:hypothetical protein